MEKCKVLQVTLDILVGPDCNGDRLSDVINYELDRRGFTIVGSAFQGDLTESYKESNPEIFED